MSKQHCISRHIDNSRPCNGWWGSMLRRVRNCRFIIIIIIIIISTHVRLHQHKKFRINVRNCVIIYTHFVACIKCSTLSCVKCHSLQQTEVYKQACWWTHNSLAIRGGEHKLSHSFIYSFIYLFWICVFQIDCAIKTSINLCKST